MWSAATCRSFHRQRLVAALFSKSAVTSHVEEKLRQVAALHTGIVHSFLR